MTEQERAFLTPAVLLPFLAVSLIWGSTWLVITGQLGIVPPAWSIAYRFLIGAATMFLFAAVTRSSLRIGAHHHWLVVTFGCLQFCINFNGVYLAEQHVTSGLVAVVFALLLVPNTILSRLILKHPLGGRFVAGSIIAVAGIALLFVQEVRAGAAERAQVLAGIGMTLGGVLAASISNIIQASERLRTRTVPAMMAWGMLYGAGANALLALVVYGPPLFDPRPAYIAGLLYLGVVASAVTFPLHLVVLRAVGPARAAYSSLLIPVFAMLLSTIFEAYVWAPLSIAGSMLALAGLFIAIRSRRPQAVVQ